MEFEIDVLKQFIKAGWYAGRNVSQEYDMEKIKNHSLTAKAFLFEFGNLLVEDAKSYKSNVTNVFIITPAYSYFEEEDDWKEVEENIGSKLYPIGRMEPDGYRIAIDDSENLFMLGDCVFLQIASNLKESIELLIRDDWNKGFYELNLENGNWFKNRRWYE